MSTGRLDDVGQGRPARPAAWAGLIIVAAVVVAFVPTPATWVEQVYSSRLYLIGQRVLTSGTGLVGFSLLDPLAALGLGVLVWRWGRGLRRARGRRGRTALRLGLETVAAVAAAYLVFVAVWGLNYRREPLTGRLDYDPARISARTLDGLAVDGVRRLNGLHATAETGAWPTFDAIGTTLAPAFADVQRRLGATRTAVAGRPKRTLLTAYFKRAGVDGMMNPFALEVLVNDAVHPYERPFLVAHEWGHLAGYANEAEASFVGFLTCLAGDAQSRYSAWLFVVPHLVRHLSEDRRVEVYAALDETPRRHLTAIYQRLARAVPVVQRNARRVYDQFLRANRVQDGIASYGLVVELLLGTKGTALW